MSAPKTERLRPVAVLLCEDLPVPGLNGYSTYNHAFVRYLEARDFNAHLVISGPRLPAPMFRPRRRLGCTKLRIHVPGTIRLGDWHLAAHPRTLSGIFTVSTVQLVQEPVDGNPMLPTTEPLTTTFAERVVSEA